MHARCPTRPFLKVLALGFAVAGLSGNAGASGLWPSGSFWDWFRRDVADRIQITGFRRFGYHNHQVTGDREAFDLLTNSGYGDRRFTDIGSMNVSGRNVLGALTFDVNIDTNRFQDPQARRFALEVRRSGYSLAAGDIQGNLLNTNRFASFSKSLRGVAGGFESGRLRTRAIYSEARGSARTINFPGNNSVGPYFLQFTQILRGSESVRVDDVPQVLGRDYVISYESGSITFLRGPIPPTSTIVVSFEALGVNDSGGRIEGAAASYDFGAWGRLGLTGMRQLTGAGSALSQRLERFQGSGAPSTPYFLQFRPLLTRPITVRLDGILLTPIVDYFFDPNNPAIFYMTRFVSFDSTIDVVYTPEPTQTIDGDRHVWGVDYRIPLGRGGRAGAITYAQATGRLDSPVNPLEGTARGIDARYRIGDFSLFGSLRDVPREYVSVESRGFNRNERAADAGLTWTKGPWSSDLNWLNSAVSQRVVGSSGDVSFRTSRTTRLRSTVGYSEGQSGSYRLQFDRIRNRQRGLPVELDALSVVGARTAGRWNGSVSVDLQQGRAPDSLQAGAKIVDVALQTLRFDGTLDLGRHWVAGGRVGFSRVRQGDREGDGRDIGLRLGYTPTDRFQASVSHTVSKSGQLATLGGFDSGAGLGFDGNGFSGGISGTPFGLGASDLRETAVAARYRIGETWSLAASAVQRRQQGTISSNTETQTFEFRADGDIGNGHTLGFAVNRSESEFIGSNIESETTNLDVSLIANPAGRLSYSLGANFLISGGNSAFKQDSTAFDASLSYRLMDRHFLRFGYQGLTSTGEFGQFETFWLAGYEYRIFSNVGLLASYKVRDVQNRLSGSTSGAYKSRGFDIELSFSFAP
ncbi:MAG: hypothetical protein SNJ74_02070 [Fimbriimonadaceae bacterium]